MVGAGAAGLLAARCAALRGRRTLLLEKSPRPGLKVLISGGGRCNLTTTRSGDDLERQYGSRRGRFLRHALRAFPPAALRQLVESAGVPLREEDLEKLFPVSQRARDVLDALLQLAAAAGVELRTGSPLQQLQHDGAAFVLTTPQATLRSQSVVLATGGRSYPKTGATGDGYEFGRQFGHTVTRTVPALAPLAVEAAWVRELQGIVLHDVELAALAADGRVLSVRNRPILFTHKGLSGPAPMDLAGDIEEHGAGAEVRFAFLPGHSAAAVEAELVASAQRSGRQRVDSALPRHLPERLRAALCSLAGADTTLALLPKTARRRLAEVLTGLRVPVERSLGFDHAEVTRGGIALDEVDPRSMQSRRRAGLYVCGELLDVDGPIGGFNFQAAFATGRLAGLHA